jgi:hypothetical protein
MEITEPRRLYQQLAAELKRASSKVSTLWVINCPQSALSPMKKRQPHRGSRSHHHAGSGRLC